MKEIWPLGGRRCRAGHVHFEPAQGLMEVIDPDTGDPAGPHQVATLVATPFPPYRQTTLLLRYDTEDLVRPLVGSPDCELRHLPATGLLLGKRRLAVRHERGWTVPRDVLEALEAIEEVPLPARCGFWAVPGGVAVEVVTRTDSARLRRLVGHCLEGHGVPVRELRLVHERRQLRRPMPLRGDLREVAFGGTQELDDAPERAPLRVESLAARAHGAPGSHVGAGVASGARWS